MNSSNLPNDFNSFKKIYELKTELEPLPSGYPISAKVIADSYFQHKFSGMYGPRLTTLELVFPRYILAEFNTHRVFSRNASSSRAIPTKKLATNSEVLFVYPVRWGMNQPGMKASKENLTGKELLEAMQIWGEMAEYVKNKCLRLSELGLHKQWASRPMEWFSTIKVVVSSTYWDNFFFLRDHSDAQDEICHLTQHIKIAMNESEPRKLYQGQWHLPYVTDEDLNNLGIKNALRVSAARCARTSYKTMHGVTSTLEEDLDLFKKLAHETKEGKINMEENPFHASPTEHQATPIIQQDRHLIKRSNFEDWHQFRSIIEFGEEKLFTSDDQFMLF